MAGQATCGTGHAPETMTISETTHSTLQLEPRARNICARDACEVRGAVYTHRRFQGNRNFLSATLLVNKLKSIVFLAL